MTDGKGRIALPTTDRSKTADTESQVRPGRDRPSMSHFSLLSFGSGWFYLLQFFCLHDENAHSDAHQIIFGSSRSANAQRLGD